MTLPFRLNEGVYFEDTGNILLWHDSIENIKKIDSPSILANGTLLKWFNKLCFGKQKINVTISVDDYYNTKGRLEFVEFEQGNKNPRDTFEKYSALFKEHLGIPTEIKDDGYGRPTQLWTINDFQIIVGVGERFVEFEIFGIHKGEPFWKLRPSTA